MLRALDIRDMLIVDRLEMRFQPGLNVLTGETGAGKSILLDCLGFVLGWRGRADVVRPGADRGEVVAEFDIPEGHPARDVLAGAGLPVGDELLIRREVGADGRKSAWVNDRRTSGGVLQDLSAILVEVHGQQGDRGLVDPRGHRAFLDAFAGAEDSRDRTRAAWTALRRAESDLESRKAALAAAREEEESLRAWAAELEDLAPRAGEMAEIEEGRALAKAARDVAEHVVEARAAVAFDQGAGGMADKARRAVARAREGLGDRVESASRALDRAAEALSEAEAELDRLEEGISFDPESLQRADDRFHALRDAARKHRVEPDELAAKASEFRTRIEELDAGEDALSESASGVAVARAAFEAAAAELSGMRRKAARSLDRSVLEELAPLKLDRAQFETRIESAEPGPEGVDSVAFVATANPGVPPGPLAKVASGGEFSRFMLALKVCQRGGDGDSTMVFDEIDRGVGGATADAVGRRLSRLAEGGQVLVVTHSPQVAARGDHHWRVAKRESGDSVLTSVEELDGEQRIDEIARMLSGDRVSDEARAAARALLA